MREEIQIQVVKLWKLACQHASSWKECKKIKASSPYIFQLYTKKKHTPLFYRYSDFLFIPTNFQMSEADMENGDDLQILSAEFF